MANADTVTVYFYEAYYQYKAEEVLKPASSSDLMTGILEELNHQYNYRATDEDLWAIVKQNGEELYRLVRRSASRAVVWDVRTGEYFNYMPLVSYTLTCIKRW